MKKYNAYVTYKGKTFNMYVGGKDEKSVINDITDFFMKLLKDDKNIVEVKLEEIKDYE